MSSEITISVKSERTLKLPTLPNFVRDEGGGAVPIESLTQDQLSEIGQKWTEALKRKARDRNGRKMVAINKKLSAL